ncbi:unnamed protein product [Lactuca virosa]|uniref:RBR-type E3 ubiquitin transferase n=1 Tax=Lactuca virosa TaxID=75947 RepID=A0AAU9NX98_9ASTR|nr:unnamed protein product [Lactuca virosa]
MHTVVGDGAQTRFWKDVWCSDIPLRERFGRLFALALNQDARCSVADQVWSRVGHWLHLDLPAFSSIRDVVDWVDSRPMVHMERSTVESVFMVVIWVLWTHMVHHPFLQINSKNSPFGSQRNNKLFLKEATSIRVLAHRQKRVSLKNMASSSVVGVSTLHDKDESYLNSEKYAEELQLQEALIYSEASISSSSSQQDASSSSENDASSISSSSSQNDTSSTPSSASQNDASSTSSSSSSLKDSSSSAASSIPATSTPTHALKMKEPVVTSDASQSSESFFCDICMDTKSSSEMFSNATVCGHLYCSDCISGHVSAKIKENITNVKCPDPKCKEVIGPEHCRAIVPKEVLERWEEALCESLILGSEKFYCPFKDCSVMLVDDGGESVTSSECPNCHRLFCAQCKVAWHSEMDCTEFQSLNEDERNPEDIMLMQLAKSKEWRRCPSCNIIVEKQEGCHRISCRCGNHFCYGCGKIHIGSYACDV